MALRMGRLTRWTDRVEDVAAWVLLAAGLLLVPLACTLGIGVHAQMVRQGQTEALDRTATSATLLERAPLIASPYNAGAPVDVPVTWVDRWGMDAHGAGGGAAGMCQGQHAHDLDRPVGCVGARAEDVRRCARTGRDRHRPGLFRGSGGARCAVGGAAARADGLQLRGVGAGVEGRRSALEPRRRQARLTPPDFRRRPITRPVAWASKGMYGEQIWARHRAAVPARHRTTFRLIFAIPAWSASS